MPNALPFFFFRASIIFIPANDLKRVNASKTYFLVTFAAQSTILKSMTTLVEQIWYPVRKVMNINGMSMLSFPFKSTLTILK